MAQARRLAVIMFTDIVGYTALMAKDETTALEVLTRNRQIQKLLIEQYRGTWLKEMGDGVLASFDSTTDALRCAAGIIPAAREEDIELRIGVHLGEVVFSDGDVFGDGVNIAARLETLAVPGSVLFTDQVLQDIRNKPDLASVSLGKVTLRNVGEPIGIHALVAPDLHVPDALPSSVTEDGQNKQLLTKPSIFLIAGAVLIVLIALLVITRDQPVQGFERESSELPRDSPPAVATIPFSNISGEETTDFLGFALADQVINALSYLQGIIVRPSSSVRRYENTRVDPTTVRDELAVDYVLMGHYLKSQDSLRLNLELVDVVGNDIVWSETMTASATNTFELQDLVAQRVSDGLSIRFANDLQDPVATDIPEDPLAYEYYLRSLACGASIEEDRRAVALLRQAIQRDTSFAPAYGALGFRLHQLATYDDRSSRKVAIQEVLDIYNKALELNPNSLRVLSNLSFLKTELNQKEEAIELAHRMIRINPNFAQGHFVLAYAFRYAGMLEAAMDATRRSLALDPRDFRLRSGGVAFTLAGRYEEALEYFWARDGSGYTESWRGSVYLRMGEDDEARKELMKAAELASNGIIGLFTDAMLAVLDGTEQRVVADVRTAGESMEDPESMYFYGELCVLLGDHAGGLALIDRAIENGYAPYPAMKVSPFFREVRETTGYQEVLQKARSAQETFRQRHQLAD
ncbi:MAG: adenylate/guanylate cyclase domain-containing protein [Saprospiraceae bacterium]|nr:adenylate/guanylate cyclase domain-containing protein [Saprospiraceae bacterium]